MVGSDSATPIYLLFLLNLHITFNYKSTDFQILNFSGCGAAR